jgi:predicted transcriptional regulator
VDSRSDRVVALMSIQPQFAERIITGDKRVEFRKTLFRYPLSHVIIYCTEPVQQVIGFFEVEALDTATPQNLWERYSQVSGIPQGTFNAYYANCTTGVAIKIGRVFKLEEAVPLSVIDEILLPPQSFRYLSIEVLEYLISQSASSLPLSVLQSGEAGPDLLQDNQPSLLIDSVQVL